MLELVAKRIDDLLLPQLSREVVPLRTIDIAIACIRQGPLAVQMQPSFGKAVIEEKVVERPLAIDVDAAERIDQLLECGEVDAHERVHRLVENIRHGVGHQARPTARIAALDAVEMRVIESMHAIRADAHPQVPGNQSDGDLTCRGLEADEHDRVGVLVSVGVRAAADAEDQDVQAILFQTFTDEVGNDPVRRRRARVERNNGQDEQDAENGEERDLRGILTFRRARHFARLVVVGEAVPA